VNAAALHPWRVSHRQAVEIQVRLRAEVRLEPLAAPPRLVAGADVAYSRLTHRMYAAIVVLSVPEMAVVETRRAVMRARFPYIPGLFTFRELPPLLGAFERLRAAPDLLMFDGHGLAHPRRFGLACHAGLLLDTPSVGCAKKRLVGEHDAVGPKRGDRAPLTIGDEMVGAVVRTRPGVKPVYVSPGHRIDIDSAVGAVLLSLGRYRIPEPTRLAHQATAAMMREIDRRDRAPARRTYPDFVGAVPREP